ncbi:branched-chain amino acid transporter [Actinomyces sp. 2119]|uniref:branched-chain amino acid transporter permease n=1 Tax=Actinomyces sp. 2119 TaxID=2321393 RepID=UPI000E6C9129|nr:AzlD domain-containing protein [Actinomyces sp. 2119]RJF41144.1 branched-chain amino acid transporter [Actinomyces sp. 2119]
MLSTTQVAVAVLVVAVITFGCRILPFVLLRGRGNSALLDFLSQAMPLGVMVVLVAYTLEGVTLEPATWVPAAVGIAGTAVLHLWRRSIALSLVGGTAAYVALSLAMA